MANNPFAPGRTGSSKAITATSSSAAVTMPSGSGWVLHCANSGTSTVFINFGTSSVTAASDGTDFALLPGVVELITFSDSATYIATKTASGSSVLYISRGDGS